MLTREATMARLEELEAEGYEPRQEEAMDGILDGESATAEYYRERRYDAAQWAIDWIAARGNTDEALREFLGLFQFTDSDIMLATARMSHGANLEATQKLKLDNASVAACLVNEWLNYAVRNNGNSDAECSLIQLTLMKADDEAFGMRFCRAVPALVLLSAGGVVLLTLICKIAEWLM